MGVVSLPLQRFARAARRKPGSGDSFFQPILNRAPGWLSPLLAVELNEPSGARGTGWYSVRVKGRRGRPLPFFDPLSPYYGALLGLVATDKLTSPGEDGEGDSWTVELLRIGLAAAVRSLRATADTAEPSVTISAAEKISLPYLTESAHMVWGTIRQQGFLLEESLRLRSSRREPSFQQSDSDGERDDSGEGHDQRFFAASWTAPPRVACCAFALSTRSDHDRAIPDPALGTESELFALLAKLRLAPPKR